MQLLSKMESQKGREAMEKTQDPAREEYERMLARCQETPTVQKALEIVYEACGALIFAMATALAELREEDTTL